MSTQATTPDPCWPRRIGHRHHREIANRALPFQRQADIDAVLAVLQQPAINAIGSQLARSQIFHVKATQTKRGHGSKLKAIAPCQAPAEAATLEEDLLSLVLDQWQRPVAQAFTGVGAVQHAQTDTETETGRSHGTRRAGLRNHRRWRRVGAIGLLGQGINTGTCAGTERQHGDELETSSHTISFWS